jgi:hypothetical protein
MAKKKWDSFDIGGIVDHHCLNFLFIKRRTMLYKTLHKMLKNEQHELQKR